jgi:hypothetical protein
MNTTPATHLRRAPAAVAATLLATAAVALTLSGTLGAPAGASPHNVRVAELGQQQPDRVEHNARVAEYMQTHNR